MFKEYKNRFYPARIFEGEKSHEKLPPAVYRAIMEFSTFGNSITFVPVEDPTRLIEMGGKYREIKDKIIEFFTPEAKALYESLNFHYLLGALLFGEPGTGKSCFIKLVANELAKKYGIPTIITDASVLKHIEKLIFCARAGDKEGEDPTQLLLVFEEVDRGLKDYDFCSDLSTLTDGSLGINNLAVIATTNFIDRIPGYFKNRPSRFAIVEEFDEIDPNIVEDYLMNELRGLSHQQLREVKPRISDNIVAEIVKARVPIDHVKSIILDQIIYKLPLDKAIERASKVYGAKVNDGYQ